MAALGPRLPALGRPRWAALWGRRGLPAAFPAAPAAFPAAPAAAPRRAMAGHNRWSKVRHVKGPRDERRGRLFQRMAQLLRAAAAEGGPEAALNPALAAVLEQCRTHNVPKATIEAALRSVRDRPAGGCRLLLEARGPGGSLLLLDVLTDNVRRCQAELRTLLDRNGGSLAEGVRHNFDTVGVVRVSGQGVAMEVALEVAAAAGAQDVVAEDEDELELKFLCDPSALRSVRRRLEAAGLRPLSAAREFVPRSPLAPGPAARTAAERLLRALAERPDVVRTFHNVGPAVGEGSCPPDTAPSGQ
ncbi:translational activator of cytochrome c oxidase 1-like [Chamaea fasciata]|uniref:translational activator of cytochrome c oxidase 1-like n=1 Tax=Chamaea fasciata TaxID=190680 RepID=UPI00336AD4CC